MPMQLQPTLHSDNGEVHFDEATISIVWTSTISTTNFRLVTERQTHRVT
jgi:hypothetical protein